MLNVVNAGFSAGRKKILTGVSFSAEKGKVCAVIGPNGAGKSTLLKLIAGLLKPETGDIRVDGEDVTVMGGKERAKHVAYLPQSTNVVPSSVFDAVLLGRKPRMGWYPSEKDFDRTSDVIKRAGLSAYTDKCVTRLSGGEFQKVLIARAMVQDSPVMLLDEPVNHLDIKNRIDVMELTAEVTVENGLASVVVMHDLNLAFRYADTLLVLDQGCRKAFCSIDDTDTDLLSDIYRVPVALTSHMGRATAVY